MFLSETNVNEIIKIVSRLTRKSSTDYNDIMSFVKNIIHLAVQSFTYICNLSFAIGILPDAMKIAKVIPIYKTGVKDEFNNYRPICYIHNFLRFLRSYMMIDFKNLSEKIISYQTANLVSELAGLLA